MKLREAHLYPHTLLDFYRSTIEYIFTNCITVWYGNCTVLPPAGGKNCPIYHWCRATLHQRRLPQMLPKESEKYHQRLVSPQSQTVHSTPIEETLKVSSLSHQQTRGQFLSLSCQPTELQSQALNYILD